MTSLFNQSDQSNPVYTDGYPDLCIICSDSTQICTFGSKNTFINFGSGFCSKCDIRFSKSDKIWKCCKVIESNNKSLDNLCCKTIEGIKSCSNSLHSKTEYLKYTQTSVEFKYPFKKTCQATVVDV